MNTPEQELKDLRKIVAHLDQDVQDLAALMEDLRTENAELRKRCGMPDRDASPVPA